jgi:hypothetical protein
MFMLIGVPGLVLSVVWYVFYRDRKDVSLNDAEKAYFAAPARRAISPAFHSLNGWVSFACALCGE